MKKLLIIAIATIAVGCSVDQALVEENDRLKKEIETLTDQVKKQEELAIAAAALAKESEAEALAQLRRAEEATLMAQANLEEANRQKQAADKLAEQLKNCK